MPVSIMLVSVFAQPNESRMIKALRAAGHIAFELVAEEDGVIIGHICFSKLMLPEGWLALGPVSVKTERQGQGIGGELIRYGLDQARQMDAQAVVVVGGPDYYRRFGFVFDGPARLASSYPAQYTGLYPIAPSTAIIEATLVYPPEFAKV